MTNQEKLQEVFSDKAYVESIAKMSAEDAAKSLNEKGVEVTADDLMKARDFILAHKEELQNGELTEKDLTEVAGGLSGAGWALVGIGVVAVLSGGIGLFLSW